jgi:hypothetical protein
VQTVLRKPPANPQPQVEEALTSALLSRLPIHQPRRRPHQRIHQVPHLSWKDLDQGPSHAAQQPVLPDVNRRAVAQPNHIRLSDPFRAHNSLYYRWVGGVFGLDEPEAIVAVLRLLSHKAGLVIGRGFGLCAGSSPLAVVAPPAQPPTQVP